MINGRSRSLTVVACRKSGSMLVNWNSSCDAHQMEAAGAAILNSALYHSGRRLAIQNEITSPSSAPVPVPAADPNTRTGANTYVSDTEIVAGIEGSLTVAEPLTKVRTARRYHCASIG